MTEHAEATAALVGVATRRTGADRWELSLRFADPPDAAPTAITEAHVRLLDAGARATRALQVLEVSSAGPQVTVTVAVSDSARALTVGADPPPYQLELVGLVGLDPRRSRVPFVLGPTAAPETDCVPETPEATEELSPAPPINYLARDYEAMRQQMLGRLALTMPGWAESNPADLMVTLVEALAYAGDRASYHQDAVATEAYLGTCRLRRSARRHAVLADYAMHQGCGARAFVSIQVEVTTYLDAGARLVTRSQDAGSSVVLSEAEYTAAVRGGADVFLTMERATLQPSLNELELASSSAPPPQYLAQGATRATLPRGYPDLAVGDVIVFEEVRSPVTGLVQDANPAHRQAVRLTRVTVHYDSNDQPTSTEIEWNPEDALRFVLWITTAVDGRTVPQVAVAYGNVVLADHGRPVEGADFGPVEVAFAGPYQPSLAVADLSFAAPLAHEIAGDSAADLLRTDPRRARACVALTDTDGLPWIARPSLLESGPFARDFVVEPNNPLGFTLRFGDGTLGQQPAPGQRMSARYRRGNGTAGNVGADTIAHIVTPAGTSKSALRVIAVRNPTPASGGTDPESLDEVKLAAPQAYRSQLRGVTESDYVAIAERREDVASAACSMTVVGARVQVRVAVEPTLGRPATSGLLAAMQSYLEEFRLVGHQLEVIAPEYVPLEVVMVAWTVPGVAPDRVRNGLRRAFSASGSAAGDSGFFWPGNWELGQPVYLSDVLDRALQVEGVAWVNSSPSSDPRVRFAPVGAPFSETLHNIEQGYAPITTMQIARALSDPDDPSQGQASFFVVEGR